MKFLTWFALFCITPFFLTAQNNNSQITIQENVNSQAFSQNSMAVIGLNFNENLSNEVVGKLKNLQIPQEYIQIQFENNIIEPTFLHSSFLSLDDEDVNQQLEELLNQKKVGHQILSNWFNRQPDSSFNLAVLKQRGYANVSITDLIDLAESKNNRTELMESGLNMINQTYLVVFDFNEIMTMKEYYKLNGVKKQYQFLNGFISSVNCYLLKFDFNGSVAKSFFRDFWIFENDLYRKEKIDAFENSEFPFISVKKYQFEITSSQHNADHPLAPETQKTENELLQNLAELAFENVLSDAENQNEPFILKTKIQEVGPISAKLGNKGGLKFDQRYFVYENRLRKNGEIYAKRVGVIKSNKIIDTVNENLDQSQNSSFYQIAGDPIYKGMYLKKRNDIGFNFFAGNAFSGLPGFTGRIEYYFSKMLGDLISSGKSAPGATSVKIYLSGGYNQKQYNIDDQFRNHTFKRGSFGISKDFYPLRFIHWGPYLGYGLETVKWESSKNMISSNFAEMGVRVGLNIAYNIQLVASYNYYHFVNSILLDGNKEVIEKNFPYQNKFTDRSRSGISMGIRIML